MDTSCTCPFTHVGSAVLFASVAVPLICAALLYLGSVPKMVAKVMAASVSPCLWFWRCISARSSRAR